MELPKWEEVAAAGAVILGLLYVALIAVVTYAFVR